MSRLSEWLCDRVASLELSQKEIATRLHESLGAAKPALSFTTVQTKLSKLLGGDAEGERCFFGDPRRERALAKTFGTTVEQLASLRAVRTLVLDPALDPAAVAYLVAAADRPDATHACVRVSVDAAPEGGASSSLPFDALRAKAKENRGALVVLAGLDDKSKTFFEGASIEITTVKKHPRGWTLTSAPEMVPLPPPREPPLFSADGQPMMPHEQFAADARARAQAAHDRFHRSYPATRYIQEAMIEGTQIKPSEAHVTACDEQGEIPSFPIGGELATWISKASDAVVLPKPIPWNDIETRTFWWVHGRKVLAAGPDVAKLAAVLSPHHAVGVPAVLSEWKEGLERWNPWRLDEPESAASVLRARVIEECGIDPLSFGSAEWARARREPKGDLAIEPFEEAGIADARDLLAGLATRGLEPGPMPELPFVLDQAASAPLRLLRGTDREHLHVLANLGAGRVLRIRARSFRDERRRTLELVTDSGSGDGGASTRYYGLRWVPLVYDGGDVRLWLECRDEPLLEGFALPARARRKREADEAEARRQQEDDD